MGCDDLFEKGFIYVDNGKFKINSEKESIFTPNLLKYIKKIEDNVCGKFNNDTEKYFKWHKSNHVNEMVEFSVNDVVSHKAYGIGKIVGVKGDGENQKLNIIFQNDLHKELVNKYANLKLLVS